MQVVLQVDEVFDAKPAIMRAFQMAKASSKSNRKDVGDDFIELRVDYDYLYLPRIFYH